MKIRPGLPLTNRFSIMGISMLKENSITTFLPLLILGRAHGLSFIICCIYGNELIPTSFFFSFRGCGFYVGVHKAMETRWGKLFYEKLSSVHGDSAGCIFAMGIALGKTAEQVTTLYFRGLNITNKTTTQFFN